MKCIQLLYLEAKIQKLLMFEIISNISKLVEILLFEKFYTKLSFIEFFLIFKSILQYSNFRNTSNHVILKNLKENKKHKEREELNFLVRILVNILRIYLHITILN